MSQDRNMPKLLLVEDDPVSCSFLSEALTSLPARVDTAATIAAALSLARENQYQLWLIDAHLPDGDGCDCLEALSEILPGPSPALAITAGASREELDALCASGFLEVLPKPVSIAVLQSTVRRLLGEHVDHIREPSDGKLPVWDEARALAAIGGSRSSLLALRKLFLAELPSLQQLLCAAQQNHDVDAMRAVLHKLTAGCGFVGASRLASAVTALGQSPMDAQALRLFEFAACDALEWQTTQD